MSHVVRRAAAAAAVIVVASFAAHAEAAPKALDLVFYGPYLANYAEGATISYRFARAANDPKLDKSFEDDVRLKIAPGGRSDMVLVELFSGERKFAVGPIARSGNPVVLGILENDVREMQKVLGGSPYYIRNRMLETLQGDPPVEAVKVTYGGKEHDGWKITMKPFENDRNSAKLGNYAQRSYEITFSDGVPGGLFALRSVTPKSGGTEPLLVEELKLAADAAPAEAKESETK